MQESGGNSDLEKENQEIIKKLENIADNSSDKVKQRLMEVIIPGIVDRLKDRSEDGELDKFLHLIVSQLQYRVNMHPANRRRDYPGLNDEEMTELFKAVRDMANELFNDSDYASRVKMAPPLMQATG